MKRVAVLNLNLLLIGCHLLITHALQAADQECLAIAGKYSRTCPKGSFCCSDTSFKRLFDPKADICWCCPKKAGNVLHAYCPDNPYKDPDCFNCEGGINI